MSFSEKYIKLLNENTVFHIILCYLLLITSQYIDNNLYNYYHMYSIPCVSKPTWKLKNSLKLLLF